MLDFQRTDVYHVAQIRKHNDLFEVDPIRTKRSEATTPAKPVEQDAQGEPSTHLGGTCFINICAYYFSVQGRVTSRRSETAKKSKEQSDPDTKIGGRKASRTHASSTYFSNLRRSGKQVT